MLGDLRSLFGGPFTHDTNKLWNPFGVVASMHEIVDHGLGVGVGESNVHAENLVILRIHELLSSALLRGIGIHQGFRKTSHRRPPLSRPTLSQLNAYETKKLCFVDISTLTSHLSAAGCAFN